MTKEETKPDKSKEAAPPAPPGQNRALTLSLDTTPGLQLTDPQHGWWDTYNAAITGMWSNPTMFVNGAQYLHLQAVLAAEAAHGAYPPDPPPEP